MTQSLYVIEWKLINFCHCCNTSLHRYSQNLRVIVVFRNYYDSQLLRNLLTSRATESNYYNFSKSKYLPKIFEGTQFYYRNHCKTIPQPKKCFDSSSDYGQIVKSSHSFIVPLHLHPSCEKKYAINLKIISCLKVPNPINYT